MGKRFSQEGEKQTAGDPPGLLECVADPLRLTEVAEGGVKRVRTDKPVRWDPHRSDLVSTGGALEVEGAGISARGVQSARDGDELCCGKELTPQWHRKIGVEHGQNAPPSHELFRADGGSPAIRQRAFLGGHGVSEEVESPLQVEHGGLGIRKSAGSADVFQEFGTDPVEQGPAGDQHLRGREEDMLPVSPRRTDNGFRLAVLDSTGILFEDVGRDGGGAAVNGDEDNPPAELFHRRMSCKCLLRRRHVRSFRPEARPIVSSALRVGLGPAARRARYSVGSVASPWRMSKCEDPRVTPAEEREARLALEPMRPATPPAHFLRGTRASLIQIWQRRDLLVRLVRREIRARYKDSVLGLVWSLVRPLVSLLIYFLVMGKILGAAKGINDFAVYMFTGLTLWQLVSESLSATTGSVVGNSGIIKKIQLPREIFPLAAIGGALFNFFMQFIILLVAALIASLANGHTLFTYRLLYIPASLILVLVWVTAFGLLLSAANVYLRDVQYLVEVALLVGMWASPIVYSWAMVTEHAGHVLQEIYLANPITLGVFGFQQALWTAGEGQPTATYLFVRMLIALGVGVVLLTLSQRVFAVMQRDFAQEL